MFSLHAFLFHCIDLEEKHLVSSSLLSHDPSKGYRRALSHLDLNSIELCVYQGILQTGSEEGMKCKPAQCFLWVGSTEIEATENNEVSTVSLIEMLSGSRTFGNSQAIFLVVNHMGVLVLFVIYLFIGLSVCQRSLGIIPDGLPLRLECFIVLISFSQM